MTSKYSKNISDTLGYRLMDHLFLSHFNVTSNLLGLVHTSDGSDGSDGSGVVSGVGIGRKFWSIVNRQDGIDVSGSGIRRKRNSSDPSDSDSVELPTPLTIPLFDLHWIVTLLALPIPTPLPIPSLVWTSPYWTCAPQHGEIYLWNWQLPWGSFLITCRRS